MKKLIAIALIAAAATSLVGCNGTTAGSAKPVTTPSKM